MAAESFVVVDQDYIYAYTTTKKSLTKEEAINITNYTYTQNGDWVMYAFSSDEFVVRMSYIVTSDNSFTLDTPYGPILASYDENSYSNTVMNGELLLAIPEL